MVFYNEILLVSHNYKYCLFFFFQLLHPQDTQTLNKKTPMNILVRSSTMQSLHLTMHRLRIQLRKLGWVNRMCMMWKMNSVVPRVLLKQNIFFINSSRKYYIYNMHFNFNKERKAICQLKFKDNNLNNCRIDWLCAFSF